MHCRPAQQLAYTVHTDTENPVVQTPNLYLKLTFLIKKGNYYLALFTVILRENVWQQ